MSPHNLHCNLPSFIYLFIFVLKKLVLKCTLDLQSGLKRICYVNWEVRILKKKKELNVIIADCRNDSFLHIS